MKERYLLSEHTEIKEIVDPGLTANAKGSYAEYGDIFMAEAAAELAVTPESALVPKEIKKAEKAVENFEAAGHVAWEELAPKEQEVIQEKINKYNNQWSELIKDEGSTAYIQEVARVLQIAGVTLEQYLKDRKYYEGNLYLFKKKDKEEAEKSKRLIKEWTKYFTENDAVDELNSKWYIIHTLAISANLSPRQFARLYKWESYFTVKKPEILGSLKELLLEIVKEQLLDVITGTFVDDSNLSPEENKKRRKAFASVLWGGVNQKRQEEAKKNGQKDVIGYNEKSVQKQASELGITPARQKRDKDGQLRDIENPVEVFTAAGYNEKRLERVEEIIQEEFNKDFKFNYDTDSKILERFYEAHEIGKVYQLTPSEIRQKTAILHQVLLDLGVKSADQRRNITRKIIEKGLAGVDDAKNEWEERGLNDEQVQNAESIIQMMNSSGFNLDWDNPTILTYVAKITRELPPGRIQQEVFDRVKAMIIARISKELKNINEAQKLTEEEKAGRQKMWDEWIEANKQDVLNISDEGRKYFHKDVQWARANNLTPEQAGLKFSDYTKVSNFGREYNPTEKPEDVRSTDLPKSEMSESEKTLFDKEWKRFQENLSILGVDPNSADVVRQIEQAREQGIFPSEFEFNMPHVDREQIDDVVSAWEDLAQLRYEAGRPLIPAEQRAMAEAIKRGEYPPDNLFPAESGQGGKKRRKKRNEGTTGMVQLENGEKIQGRLTMWEEIVEFMNKKGQIFDSNRAYIGDSKQRMAEVRYSLEEQLFENRTPDNIEDIAWQIGRSAPDKYGITGKHPVLEVVYREDGERDGIKYKKGQKVKFDPHLYNLDGSYNPLDSDITVSRVNQGNFMRWLRDRMLTLHGDEPDDPLNFEAKISIDKSFRPFYFAEARMNTQKYFRSEFRAREHHKLKADIAKETDPEKIRQLNQRLSELDPIVMENLAELGFKQATWSYGVDRDNNLNYRFRSGNKEEFVKMMMEKMARSAFTKTAWGKSLFEWILTWDQNFGEEDHKLGAAINGAYLIYYNLTDTYKLYQMLGSKSALLSEEGLMQSRDEAAGIYDEDGNVTRKYAFPQEGNNKPVENKEKADAARKAYMSDSSIHQLFRFSKTEMENMQKAFGGKLKFEQVEDDKNGNPQWREVDQNGNQLINEWRYIKKLNINQSPQFDTRLENVVHTAIKRDIARVFDLTIPDDDDEEQKVRDVLNVNFAQNFAHLMTNWTGAQARNNQTAAGYDAYVALLKTRTYRLKYAANKRAEAFGNPHTMHMFKGLIADMMSGIRTEAVISEEEINKEGSRYANRTTKSYKSPYEVMEEMYEAWTNGSSVEEIKKNYIEKSGQLLFPANTLKYYANDQIMRGMNIYDQIIDAQEIKLEKFTKIDPWKGVTFERDQFQAAVQEKFLKPMRYLLSTWSQTDFSQMVRTNVASGRETDWQEMSLAESMFGREMLDVPEFWETAEEPKAGDPKYDEKKKVFDEFLKQGAKKFETRDGDGNYSVTWRIPHKISGKEINLNRTQLIKQMAKMRIAAELYEHVDLHSTDPRYNFIYYETIIQALETLPGGIAGDETDMKKSRTKIKKGERYFSPKDIEWIRKKSHTEQWRTVGQAVLIDGIGKGLWGGLTDAFKISFKHISGDFK